MLCLISSRLLNNRSTDSTTYESRGNHGKRAGETGARSALLKQSGKLQLVGFFCTSAKHFVDGSVRVAGVKIHTAHRIFEQKNFESFLEAIGHRVFDAIVRSQTADQYPFDAVPTQQIRQLNAVRTDSIETR